MNNFKKIGLTALAGSLAAVSANAVELSVSGETTVSYVSNTAEKVNTIGGSTIGTSTGITFSGSGELENGWTVSSSNILNDGNANALSSSQLNLTMGSMGTIQLNSISGSAVNAIDDVTPSAWEEAYGMGALADGTGHNVGGDAGFFGSSVNSGSIQYTTPALEVSGATVTASIVYDPNSAWAD